MQGRSDLRRIQSFQRERLILKSVVVLAIKTYHGFPTRACMYSCTSAKPFNNRASESCSNVSRWRDCGSAAPKCMSTCTHGLETRDTLRRIATVGRLSDLLEGFPSLASIAELRKVRLARRRISQSR